MEILFIYDFPCNLWNTTSRLIIIKYNSFKFKTSIICIKNTYIILVNCNSTDLKCTLSTQTVIQTLSDTRIIVKRRYFPSKGMARDVGGMISANSKKNTVKERRIEMHRVIWKALAIWSPHWTRSRNRCVSSSRKRNDFHFQYTYIIHVLKFEIERFFNRKNDWKLPHLRYNICNFHLYAITALLVCD